MIIKGKEVKLKYSLRSLFAFEQMTNKAFEVKTLLDEYVFLYCMIISNNDIQLTFSEFIDEAENHPEYMTEFQDFLQTQYKIQG